MDDDLDGLDFETPEVDVDPVSKMDTFDLLDRMSDIKTRLLAMGEALFPTSQEGRDLHSQRAALLIEYSKRTQG